MWVSAKVRSMQIVDWKGYNGLVGKRSFRSMFALFVLPPLLTLEFSVKVSSERILVVLRCLYD
jgi:hypothetical protein